MNVGFAGTHTRTALAALEQTLLDDVCEKLSCGRVEEGMNKLMPGLKARRLISDSREWAKVVEMCQWHPLRDLIYQDPFTHRAYHKPRGYAGDAVLLDYIYGREEGWPAPEGTTELG